MRKLFFFAAIFAATAIQAQTIDTVKNAIQVRPMVVNALQKDTVYQIKVERMWAAPEDTTVTTYFILYDRKAKKLGEDNVVLPYSFLQSWTQNQQVFNYILTFLGLQKRN